MTLLEKIKAIGEKYGVKLSVDEPAPAAVQMMAQGKLADGTLIASPAEEWAEGVEIFVLDADGNPSPAPDGEHVTEDGATIVVEGGKIKEIRAKVEEEVEMSSEKMLSLVDDLAGRLAAVESKLSATEAKLSATETQLSAAQKEATEAKAKVAELSKKPAADSVKKVKAELSKEEKPVDIMKLPRTERVHALLEKAKAKTA